MGALFVLAWALVPLCYRPLGLAQQLQQVFPGGLPGASTDRFFCAADSEQSVLPPGVVCSAAALFCDNTVRNDAQLNDVFFVDRENGWAVGDRGTIWHTSDGGAHWSLQASGVACPLHSVWFVDARTGWVAGGYVRPCKAGSSGVVLHTTDGGEHWRPVAAALLPRLRRIAFFDGQAGWAAGDCSFLFASGLLISKSAGRAWENVPSEVVGPWQAADLAQSGDGMLARCDGNTASVRGGRVTAGRTPSVAPRGIRAIRLVRQVEPATYGWLVGDGGLVMLTGDLGRLWQPPPGQPPAGIDQVDLEALAVRGPKVWVAGKPGTRVFYSPDAGHSWEAFSTGQSLPIRAMCFADDLHGWAVGAMGTILATVDGGRSWQRQRCGGTRAAVLGVFARSEDVPLELLAKLAAEDGYLTVLQLIAGQRSGTGRNDLLATGQSVHEALLQVGACGADRSWRFPTPERLVAPTEQQILELWNEAHDGRGIMELESFLVRLLRQWRPEVVITHGGSQLGDPAAQLVQQTLLRAVEQASEPTAYAEQISQLGLEPWQVRRVLAVERASPGDTQGVLISGSEVAERLGCSLGELAAAARWLLGNESGRSVQTEIAWHCTALVDRAKVAPRDTDPMAGIALFPGGEARRMPLERADSDHPRLVAARRRNLAGVLAAVSNDPGKAAAALGQIERLTAELGPHSAAEMLYRLAEQYLAAGHWRAACEAMEVLAEKYPRHPLCEAALRWLIAYYASGEVGWHEQTMRPAELENTPAVPVSFTTAADRAERAAYWAKRLQRDWPQSFADPRVRFPLAVADRRRGFPRQAEQFFLTLQYRPEDDPWGACAAAERWLANQTVPGPKPLAFCTATRQVPHLDAVLDDPVWQRASALELSGPGAASDIRTRVRLARDANFLYLAIEADKAPGLAYSPRREPRRHDSDLERSDRVELFLDVDRDYVTYYCLAVDYGGRPCEHCWGNRRWNPQWYIASQQSQQRWTVEAAIQWKHLVPRSPSPGTAWALGLRRIIPSVGHQSWKDSAQLRVAGQHFGLLIFP